MARLILVGAAMALAGTVESVGADPRLPPTVEYRADLTVVTGSGAPRVSRIYRGRMRDRQEIVMPDLGPDPLVMLTDMARGRHTTLDPVTKLALTEPTPASMVSGLPIADVTAERIGEETVAGVPTVKYRVQAKTHFGHPFTGFAWTTVDNVYVRLEGEYEQRGQKIPFTFQLRDLVIGPQDPALFTIPPEYRSLGED